MKKVVTYARVSTQEQALKDLSIPAQRKAMVREVASQGAEILAEFVDEGESAYHSALKRRLPGHDPLRLRQRRGHRAGPQV